ncbi:MAG: ABC transporter permease [Promethearchaeota archaeon]
MKKFKVSKRSIIVCISILPLLWFLLWTVLYPLINSIFLSLGLDEGRLSFKYFQEFFSYSKNIQAYLNTFVLAMSTVLVCGIIGTTLAFIINRFNFWGKKIFDILLLIPMMIPGVLFTIAFMQIYGETGFIPQILKQWLNLKSSPFALTGFWGILFIHATTQYIFFYIMVSSALKRIDSSIYESARSLGASKFTLFRTITIPLLIPAFVAAGVLTFMSGVASFAAPNLIGGSFRVMSVQILMTKTNGFYNLVSVQGLMLASMSITFFLIMKYYETRRNYIMDVKGKPLVPNEVKGVKRNLKFCISMCLMLSVIILPIIAILFLSFVPRGAMAVDIFPKTFNLDNYRQFFEEKRILQPFINSLKLSLISVTIAMIIGTISSYIIVKTKIMIKHLIELLVFLPWALPASTVAVNMILAFNKPTPFAFNKVLVGTSLLMPLTYAVTRLTLIVRSTSASLLQLDNSVEEASRSLGANWFQTFTKIIVPIISPGIFAGAMLGFVSLVGEYTISTLMYTISTLPVSVAMTSAMYDFNIGLAMVYGVFLVIITVVIVTFAKKIKKVGDFTF